MFRLERIKRTDPRILANMENHYSQPKGFVGRNICYAILWDNQYYGSIVGGSATLHLPNRENFINNTPLTSIVNNIFYHVEKVNDKYPRRNFAEFVLKEFRKRVAIDWELSYGDKVLWFESLVELPRTGEIYRRDGWKEIGITKGYTCKRTGGKSTDSWTGKRTWDVENLRPKRVFIRENTSDEIGTVYV